MRRTLLIPFLSALLGLAMLSMPVARALEPIDSKGINEAVYYGLKNQDMGLSFFLGPNWIEGENGTLLNVYTPFVEIARSVVHKKSGPTTPNGDDIKKARQKSIEDINYIYHHPTVKFMVALYGNDRAFSKGYYATVEGVGRGRNKLLQPSKLIRNFAEKEEGAGFAPFMAVNSYHFRYADIASMDEIIFKLHGKDLKPQTFKIKVSEIR